MDFRKLHPWIVTAKEGVEIQKRLRSSIELKPFSTVPRFLAGVDISFNRFSSTAFAAVVVLDARTLEVIEERSAIAEMTMPYIPGLLSFREIPILIEAWKKVKQAPDVVLVDGMGIAHPRRMGIACHFGLVIDRPTIGCGKSLLTGTHGEISPEAGASVPLMDRGERIGALLRTRERSNPLIISPGHKMDIPSALRIVEGSLRGFRLPEPTRQAHLAANRARIEAKLAA